MHIVKLKWKDAIKKVASNNSYAKYWNESSASQMFEDFINAFTIVTEPQVITSFGGWEEQSDDTTLVNKYDIDDVKVVTVTSELFSFTFDASKTPVLYSRKEKKSYITINKLFTSY